MMRVIPNPSENPEGFSWIGTANSPGWRGLRGDEDFEICVSKETTCGRIEVEFIRQEEFEITWNGQVLEKSPEVKGRQPLERSVLTAVEFGNGCVPECAQGEGLYEFHYRRLSYQNGDDSYSLDLEDCRVEDRNGNTIKTSYAHRRLPSTENHWIDRKCLPKNDCYRFIMGKYRGEFWTSLRSFGEHASVSFDGETLFESRAWFYESFEFGYECDPPVLPESTVEFFINDALEGEFSSWSWELLLMSHKGIEDDPVVLQRGTRPTDSDVSLHYRQMQVPKDSCLFFSLKILDYSSSSTNKLAKLKLSMDGTIYHHSRIFENQWHTTTYLGNCTVAEESSYSYPICNRKNETLLEFDFQTASVSSSPTDTDWSDNNPYLPSRDTEKWYITDILLGSYGKVEEYELDSSYRIVQCISNKICNHAFQIHEKSDIESYSIKLDGVEMISASTNHQSSGWTKSKRWGRVFEFENVDCKPTSGGGLSDALICTIFFCVMLLPGIWEHIHCTRRRGEEVALQKMETSESSKHHQEDPLPSCPAVT